MSDPQARAGLAPDAGPDDLYEQARRSAGDAAAALALAPRIAEALPLPGSGSTIELWEGLARLGMIDLTVARTIEPQLDARAILAEAGDDAPCGTWVCSLRKVPASGSPRRRTGTRGGSTGSSRGARWLHTSTMRWSPHGSTTRNAACSPSTCNRTQ